MLVLRLLYDSSVSDEKTYFIYLFPSDLTRLIGINVPCLLCDTKHISAALLTSWLTQKESRRGGSHLQESIRTRRRISYWSPKGQLWKKHLRTEVNIHSNYFFSRYLAALSILLLSLHHSPTGPPPSSVFCCLTAVWVTQAASVSVRHRETQTLLGQHCNVHQGNSVFILTYCTVPRGEGGWRLRGRGAKATSGQRREQ